MPLLALGVAPGTVGGAVLVYFRPAVYRTHSASLWPLPVATPLLCPGKGEYGARCGQWRKSRFRVRMEDVGPTDGKGDVEAPASGPIALESWQ
jgi:hypothetical protein